MPKFDRMPDSEVSDEDETSSSKLRNEADANVDSAERS